ncbi:MAG: HlyD family efflux transporter periplasmic adaptor subunit [Hyphomonadaceae bacterium]|nr:HlyD family efflux transporter periplasmic adaptor subunit [Hyphomonadaceae bacterium]
MLSSLTKLAHVRMRPLHVAIAVAAVALGVGAAWWLADHAGVIVTSDARVRARMVTISSDVAGRIVEMRSSAGDVLKLGAAIARLDDREARIGLAATSLEMKALEAQIAQEKTRASLARSRGNSRVDGRRSGLAAAGADTVAARAMLQNAEADYARMRSLHASGFVSQAAMDRAATGLETARQSAARAEAAVGEGRASMGEAEAEAGEARVIEHGIEALALQAHALRQRIALQKVELEQHTVMSPLNGVIDEIFADAGEHIAPGARILLAHDPADMWIEANIKETDLAAVRVGARVDIRLDASHEVCRGRVLRIGDAATSEFALIPNANPTGVFTKITQRVPVRISIGGDCRQVRPGAMATLKISTAQ